MYKDYIDRISKNAINHFDEIDPEWNFDQGHEFEIALGNILNKLLPDKYGICRGFVTQKDDKTAGDDLIIYDKLKSPLLRPSNDLLFTRKEYVPIESTYIYIEAKNTIEISDASKSTYIGKAIEQTKNIKRLEREDRDRMQFVDGFELGGGFSIENCQDCPQILNPMFTIVFSRGLRENGELVKNTVEILDKIPELELDEFTPDLLVLGKDIVIIPRLLKDNTWHSPFYLNGISKMKIERIENKAYGFGFISIMEALKEIILNQLPYGEILDKVLE